MASAFDELKRKVLEFRDERDWAQFHSPKNLAEGLSVEAGELLENFLWVGSEDSRDLPAKTLERIKPELADIFVYLIYLSNELGVDLFDETTRKLKLNAEKYPVEKSRGNSAKYTDL